MKLIKIKKVTRGSEYSVMVTYRNEFGRVKSREAAKGYVDMQYFLDDQSLVHEFDKTLDWFIKTGLNEVELNKP